MISKIKNRQGVHRRAARAAALLAFGATAEGAAAEFPKVSADPSFIDTRFMHRHAGLDLPPVMLLNEMATAEPMMPSRTPWPVEFSALRRAVARSGDVTLGGGYQGNGSIATQVGVAHTETEEASVWAGIRHDDSKPYEDGGGGRVNYGYDRLNTQAAAQWRPAAGSRVAGFVMRDSINDYRIPNYGIDANNYDRHMGSAMMEHAPVNSVFTRVEASLTHDSVVYDADNVSLRDRGSLGLAYKGNLSATRGLARGEFESWGLRHSLTADLNLVNNNIDISALYPPQGAATYRMPSAQTVSGGLSISSLARLSPQDTLTTGLRVDVAHADPNNRSTMPTVSGSGSASFLYTPQQLWTRYYGDVDSQPVTVNLSARANLTHDLEDRSGRLHLDVRRAVRNPDAGERFYANSGPAALVQVGNPNLNPEAHHRLEVGLRKDYGGFKGASAPGNPAGAWRVAVSAYGDRVVDFITADRARGQAGIRRSDGAIIYRNVEAYLAGAAAEAWWQILESWGARAKLSWTRGENLTDGIPLYQVPPLEGELVIEHRRELAPDTIGSAGLRLSFAATQNRIDSYSASGSAQDTAGATAGWAILDLFAGARLSDRAAVTFGVANLLDKHYHLHVNPLPQSPTTRLQWAPGRGAFAQATISF